MISNEYRQTNYVKQLKVVNMEFDLEVIDRILANLHNLKDLEIDFAGKEYLALQDLIWKQLTTSWCHLKSSPHIAFISKLEVLLPYSITNYQRAKKWIQSTTKYHIILKEARAQISSILPKKRWNLIYRCNQ